MGLSSSQRPKLVALDLSDNTTVAAAGNNTQTLQPRKGYIYKVYNISYHVADPSGSTSGAHTLVVQGKAGTFASGAAYIVYISSNTGSGISVGYNVPMSFTTQNPSTNTEFRVQVQSMRASYDHPLNFKYTNGTDVSQTGNRELHIWVEEVPSVA